MKIKILSKEQIEQKYGSVIDTTPTQNSTNLVTSGGVYSAIPSTSNFVTLTGSQSISNKTITSSTYNGYSLGSQCQKSYTTSVTSGSNDLVTSGAVYTAINSQSSPGGPLTNFYFTCTVNTNMTATCSCVFTYNPNYTKSISSIKCRGTTLAFATSSTNGISYYGVGASDISSSFTTPIGNKSTSATVYVSCTKGGSSYTGSRLALVTLDLDLDGWHYSASYSCT